MAGATRVILALGAGASGSAVYFQPELLKDIAPIALRHFSKASSLAPPANEFEKAALAEIFAKLNALERVQALHLQQSSAPIVINHGSSATSMTAYALSAGGLVGLYCYWKGYGWKDFTYVSKSLFERTTEKLQCGIDAVAESVRKAKAELMKRIDIFQTEVASRFDNVDNTLRATQNQMSNVATDVGGVRSTVTRMEGSLEELKLTTESGLMYTGRGIMALCHVILEAMPAKDTPSWKNLSSFIANGPQSQYAIMEDEAFDSSSVGGSPSRPSQRKTRSSSFLLEARARQTHQQHPGLSFIAQPLAAVPSPASNIVNKLYAGPQLIRSQSVDSASL